ncbi:MAG TPA: L-fucose/L-arabinose isomerase family protein [Spirochaetales bacterium]|nr:L-fucose/L-arabinose isomerase family protein [Spirochaetales bacterium]
MKIGLVGIGLDTYWPQFAGLKDKLVGYQTKIEQRLAQLCGQYTTQGPQDDVLDSVLDAGLVDSPQKAREAAALFQTNNVDALFIYVATYALSHTVLPMAQAVHGPIVILNLQPGPTLDYQAFNALGDRGVMTGEWLANCQACSVPEIASVLNIAGIKYDIVSGWLEDGEAWARIAEWVQALAAKEVIKNARIGILGHYYAGMLDVYTDVTRLAAVFGSHFELLEMDSLAALRKRITDGGEQGQAKIKAKRAQFEREFDVSRECPEEELERAAITACALDDLVREHDLSAFAYYYEGTPGSEHENIVTSVIAGNTLLTAHHIPVAGECEVKNVVAMKILDSIGAGGSFSEFYYADFADDVVLLGHDGPAHPAIAEGAVRLVPLSVYHGKPGKGLSIQMSVRHGPVTLLSVVQGAQGRTSLLVAEGESVPGPVFQIGNTNSRYRFPISAKEFINTWSKAGPAHHCAIGVGHVGGALEKLASSLGIECQKVC